MSDVSPTLDNWPYGIFYGSPSYTFLSWDNDRARHDAKLARRQKKRWRVKAARRQRRKERT